MSQFIAPKLTDFVVLRAPPILPGSGMRSFHGTALKKSAPPEGGAFKGEGSSFASDASLSLRPPDHVRGDAEGARQDSGRLTPQDQRLGADMAAAAADLDRSPAATIAIFVTFKSHSVSGCPPGAAFKSPEIRHFLPERGPRRRCDEDHRANLEPAFSAPTLE